MFFSIILFNPTSVFAYIGPGMGGGVIAAIFGIIAALLRSYCGHCRSSGLLPVPYAIILPEKARPPCQ